MSKPTQEQIDAVFAELDIAFPLRNEITIAKALVEARVTLAAAAKRAEAAEAECEALRTVDDAMVERAARATMNRVYKDNDLFADDEELLRIHREYARIALTAALAVQP